MAIKSIAKRRVHTISRRATMQQAARKMYEQHVGCLIVTELYKGSQLPVGIITDRDLALEISKDRLNTKDVLVENLMMSQPVVVEKDYGIYETIVCMKQNGVS